MLQKLVIAYCLPFCSLPRGARVVYEIEKSRSGTNFSSSLTRVDFPEPEGAEIMQIKGL
jgi:hypothetical protein